MKAVGPEGSFVCEIYFVFAEKLLGAEVKQAPILIGKTPNQLWVFYGTVSPSGRSRNFAVNFFSKKEISAIVLQQKLHC